MTIAPGPPEQWELAMPARAWALRIARYPGSHRLVRATVHAHPNTATVQKQSVRCLISEGCRQSRRRFEMLLPQFP
jgi:hypothetical protein